MNAEKFISLIDGKTVDDCDIHGDIDWRQITLKSGFNLLLSRLTNKDTEVPLKYKIVIDSDQCYFMDNKEEANKAYEWCQCYFNSSEPTVWHLKKSN